MSEKSNRYTKEEIGYIEKVIQHCENEGIIRDEREFKRAWLSRRNLCMYGMAKESDFELHLNDIEMMIERLEMSTVDYEMISDQLIERGICRSRQSANATQAYAFSWLHGQDIDRKKSQYYEHRRRLLELGIDIAIRHDISRAIPQLKRQRDIHVASALPPSWYRMPKVQHLTLVG